MEGESTPLVICCYHGNDNLWLEYQWDPRMEMFQYEMAGAYGPFSWGYMGSNQIEELAKKGWEQLGSL